jgi:hypothetical protein
MFILPERIAKKSRIDAECTLSDKYQSLSGKSSVRQATLDRYTEEKKPEKATVLPIDTKLDCLYWVKKPVPNERWKVMAAPTSKGFTGDVVDPYPLFVEGREWIGIPRFFGKEAYGTARMNNCSDGAAMNPSIKFTWKIQNTPQKPQQDAIDAWVKNQGEGVLCLPCGAGKTVIAVYLALLKHRRTLILVQNEGLLLQWIERIQMICPDAKIGIIQQKKCEIEDMDFVIGMIQTVRVSTADFQSFGLLIVDECHHIAAKTFSQSVMKTCPRYILGLSATPERRDGLTYVIHWLLGPLLFKSERRDMTPQYITQIEYPYGNQKIISYKGGMKGLPTCINNMVSDHRRNTLIDICIKKMVNNPDMNKILVISARREHLTTMFDNFKTQYDCGLYIGGMKGTDLENSKTKKLIFASFNMAQEFLDISNLNGMVLATPCPSNVEQVIGRLRENLDSSYVACKTYNDENEYEEMLDDIFFMNSIPLDVIKLVKLYTKRKVYRQRLIYDIVDTFDVFQGMSFQRLKLYKKLDYVVNRMSCDDFISKSFS